MSIPFWAAVEGVDRDHERNCESERVRARDDENCDYAFENTDVEPVATTRATAVIAATPSAT